MKSYECTIFMGAYRQGISGARFYEKDVIYEIRRFQSRNLDRKITVRITQTRFVFMHYEEPGFEISAIQYPRFCTPEHAIKSFMIDLGKCLKDHFEQLSLSIMDSDTITYLGEEDEHSG